MSGRRWLSTKQAAKYVGLPTARDFLCFAIENGVPNVTFSDPGFREIYDLKTLDATMKSIESQHGTPASEVLDQVRSLHAPQQQARCRSGGEHCCKAIPASEPDCQCEARVKYRHTQCDVSYYCGTCAGLEGAAHAAYPCVTTQIIEGML